MIRKKIDRIDQDYLDRLRQGRAPDRDAILASHPEMAPWLKEHLDLLDALHEIRPQISAMPKRIGPYVLRDVLGEGGMALVYLAYQTEPVRRPVAIKLIKMGMDTRDFIARFESERQALALMQHPGIAKVFDGGATEEGRPFFVMEFVQGMPITEYCNDRNLSIPERLRVFLDVCEAVQHAHQKGVIHRDLKPSNILVTESSGRPIPKVIDFGIAKAVDQRLTHRTVFTDHGRIIGTVEYMSPEQAAGTAGDVDTRTDIYSLGVILYELLVGRLPLDMAALASEGIDGIRKRIRFEDPPRPASRVRSLRGDLDWIILKAMEKEPARRYSSASELAADITRHLRDEPVLASPPSPLYRLGKLIRKHRVLMAAGLMVLATLFGGITVSTAQFLKARRQGQRAEAIALSLQRLIASADPFEHGHRVELAELLDGATEELRQSPPGDALTEATLRGTIGQSYVGLGMYEVAEDHLKAASEILQDVHGRDHPDAIAAFARWGHVVMHRGRLVEAESIFRKALAIQRRVLGEDHPGTLASLRDLAKTLNILGNREEAEALLRQAHRRQRNTLGEDHPGTVTTLLDLAMLLHQRGKMDEARELYEEVLGIRKQRYPEDHPRMLQVRGSLAALRLDRGEWTEAEASLRGVLQTSQRVLGEDHPQTTHWMTILHGLLLERGDLEEAERLARRALEAIRRDRGDPHISTLSAANNLAIVLRARGKYEEALGLQKEALDGQRRTLGEGHPNTLQSMSNLGLLLADLQRLDEAEPFIRGASAGLRRVLGEDHPQALRSAHHLAHLLLHLGRDAEAEAICREALEGHRRVLGEDHPETINVKNTLGFLLGTLERPAEAEGLLREAVEGRLARLGETHPDTLRAMHHLAHVLLHLDRAEEAEEWARQALRGQRHALGDRHPDVLGTLALLAELFQSRGDLDRAEKLWRRVVDMATSVLPGKDWHTMEYRSSLGACLTARARHEDAEDLLLRSYRDLRESLGPDDRRARRALRRVIDLYDAWPRPEKAEEFRRLLPRS